MKKVQFNNNTLKMAGLLYLPEDFDDNAKYPAIVCVHPGGGVKEQTSGLYAEKLAAQGFVALAYDASHQGESEGEPRLLEDPMARVEDIRCAVDYLTTLPYVDRERIGAMGICAGAGYSIAATQTERRIKAVAGVSTVDIGTVFRETWNRNVGIDGQLKLLEDVAAQRTAEANGEKPLLVHYVPEANEINETTHPDMVEAHELYRTPRGQHPNSVNWFLFTSNDKVIAFDGFAQVGTYLTQPVLLIVGERAGSLHHSEKVYLLAPGKKEIFTIKGASHIDLYDKPEYTSQAAAKLGTFFKEHLGGRV
ncbi:alpha/beta hydrolase [Klebsiella pneumoniae]|uniref:alpha/beta hydrolase n=1 Tax=Klebsiella pneumoniae TaxID=573 RepID=UPI00227546C3|nr:alpha/beta hydrolase [Klebsiella pneumoniae]WRP72318.1 alpha/beta hydrolase [Klebsiella pneumoniae]